MTALSSILKINKADFSRDLYLPSASVALSKKAHFETSSAWWKLLLSISKDLFHHKEKSKSKLLDSYLRSNIQISEPLVIEGCNICNQEIDSNNNNQRRLQGRAECAIYFRPNPFNISPFE